jgi:hypothetical protein
LLQRHLERPARQRLLRLPSCELEETAANIDALAADFDFYSVTPLDVGIVKFVQRWRAR